MTIYLYPDGFSVSPDGIVRTPPIDGAPNEVSLGETISFQDDGSVLITGMTVPVGAQEVFIYITGTKDGEPVADVAQFPVTPGDTTFRFPSATAFLGKCDGATDLGYFPCIRNAAGIGTAPRGPAKEFGEGATVLNPPVYIGGLADVVLTSGEVLVWDWDAYFTGADSYTVSPGLTNGASSNGNKVRDLYTVDPAVAETVTLTVVAENDDGAVSAFFTVTILEGAIAPRLVTPLADAVVQTGATISRNVATSFEGTDLLYSSTSSTALIALTHDGVLRNTAALSAPLAATTLAAQVESDLGAARSLAADPFDPTNASSTVTVSITAHGLSANDIVAFTGVTPGSGLTISGFYTVASTPTADTITIDAGANASSGNVFGGANVVAHIPVKPYKTLGANPLSRASAQPRLRVAATAHGLSIGDVVGIRGSDAALDLSLSALHTGAYYVWAVPDVDTFDVVVSGTGHSTTGSGGGSNVTLYKPKMPRSLGANPLSATNGSATVTLSLTGHGLSIGQRFSLHGLAAIGGLNCNGNHIVSSAPNADTITFTMPVVANAPSSPGGGSAGVLSYRGHTIPVALGSNPFSFTSGQTTVTVHAVGHGLTLGKAVYFSGATAAAGVTPSGTYRVSSVLGPDDFTITTSAASATVTGGGSAVIMHVPCPPALDHIQVGVTAEQPAALASSELRFAASYNRFPDYRTPRFRVSGEPIPLGADPFKYTNGSAVVEVSLPNHGFANDDPLILGDVGAAAGITLSGAYTVTSVISGDVFTITHGSNATANVTSGGGSNALIYFADPTSTLGNNPIATESGSAVVTITKAAHGLGPGRRVSFSGASAVGGLTLSGPYRIVSATLNTFTINAGSNASGTATGGGAAVVMTVYRHNQVRLPGDNPISVSGSTVTVAIANHMLEVGRKIVVRGAPTVGGLNINGERTIASADGSGFTFTMPSAGSTVSGVGGSTIQILPRWEDMRWTRSTPVDGVVTEAETEYNIEEVAPRLYELKMQEIGRNGDPAVQTADIALGTDPLSVTAGSSIVTVNKPAHGMSAGWLVRIRNATALGGIAIANTVNRTILTATADSFTFDAGTVADATTSGGGSSAVITPIRRDYSVWGATDGIQSFRLAYLKATASLWALWSEPWTVPAVTVTPEPSGDALWTASSLRRKGVYEDNKPGNWGLQYQRVVCWNQATRGNANGEFGICITGQDENTGKMTKDYGRTWGPLNVPGFYGSQPGGMWLDTDRDGLLVIVANKFGSQPAPTYSEFCGLYVGTLAGVVRKNLTYSNGRQAFRGPMHGGTESRRRQQQCVGARPQNAAGTLTYKQMPIYAIDNDYNAVRDGDILNIDLWQSLDNGVTWQHLRNLPLADFASGRYGVMWMTVCPNGDILLGHAKGAHIIEAETTGQNAGVVLSSTNPKKIFPADGNLNVSCIEYIDGGPSTVSGAILSVWIDRSGTNNINTNTNTNNGFYRTSNVRTTTPARVSGSNLANTYSIWSMGRSPLNHNLIAICGGDNDPMYSTDKGKTWAKIAEITPPGEEAFRYNLNPRANGTGQTTFNFCPTREKTCIVPTQQTMSWTDNFPTLKPTSTNFFDGGDTKGMGWHFSDWKQIVRVQTDSWVNTSLEGALWAQANGRGTADTAFKTLVDAAGGGTASYGINGGAALMGKNRRLIATANMNGAGKPNVLVCLDGFKTTGSAHEYGKYDTHTIIGGTNKGGVTRAARSAWSLKEPGVTGFIGKFAIQNFDAGDPNNITKIDHSSHEFIAQSMLNGDTLITWWGDHKNGSGTNDQRAGGVYRSTHDTGSNNQGEYWAPFKAGSGPSNTRAWFDAIAPDPHHPSRNRVLYVPASAPTEIWEAVKSGSDISYNRLRDLWPQLRAWMEARIGVGCYIPKTEILTLLADPFCPGLFYAAFEGSGICNWWMSTDFGVTWSPIQSNFPATNIRADMHPLTGDLFGHNTLGEHTLAPHQQVANYPNVDYVGFTAGTLRIKPEQTLTQGGVTATVHSVVLDSGSWGSNAAGRIFLRGRTGGSFSAGAATSAGGGVTTTGACTLSGAQTSIRGAITLQNQKLYDDTGIHPPAFIM